MRPTSSRRNVVANPSMVKRRVSIALLQIPAAGSLLKALIHTGSPLFQGKTICRKFIESPRSFCKRPMAANRIAIPPSQRARTIQSSTSAASIRLGFSEPSKVPRVLRAKSKSAWLSRANCCSSSSSIASANSEAADSRVSAGNFPYLRRLPASKIPRKRPLRFTGTHIARCNSSNGPMIGKLS